eukprot:290376_1
MTGHNMRGDNMTNVLIPTVFHLFHNVTSIVIYSSISAIHEAKIAECNTPHYRHSHNANIDEGYFMTQKKITSTDNSFSHHTTGEMNEYEIDILSLLSMLDELKYERDFTFKIRASHKYAVHVKKRFHIGESWLSVLWHKRLHLFWSRS